MNRKKVLVPFSFNPGEEKALDFAIHAFKDREETTITLFSTYMALPAVDTQSNPVMKRMAEGDSYLTSELASLENGLQETKAYLVANGFPGDRVEVVLRERHNSVADEIIETAHKGHYSFLVLTRHASGKPPLLGRSVHCKAIASLKDVTVCVSV